MHRFLTTYEIKFRDSEVSSIAKNSTLNTVTTSLLDLQVIYLKKN